MRYFIFFLLIVFSIPSIAQNSFSKRFYIDNSNTRGLTCVSDPNGNLYVFSEINIYFTKYFGVVSKFSPNGSHLWSKKITTGDSLFYEPRLLALGNHGVVASFEDSLGTCMVFFDTLGNLQRVLRNDSIFPEALVYFEGDSSIYFAGDSHFIFGLTLVKLDLNGNTIWTRGLDDTSTNYWDFNSLQVTSKKEIFAYSSCSNNFSGNMSVLYMDSIGHPIHYWHSTDSIYNGHTNIASTLLPGNRLLGVSFTRLFPSWDHVYYFFITDTVGMPVKWFKYQSGPLLDLGSIKAIGDRYVLGGVYTDSVSQGVCLFVLDTLLNFQEIKIVLDTTLYHSFALPVEITVDPFQRILLTFSVTPYGDTTVSSFIGRIDSLFKLPCTLSMEFKDPMPFNILTTLNMPLLDTTFSIIFYNDSSFAHVVPASYSDEIICEPTGVPTLNNPSEISVYPNPASQILFITTEKKESTYFIYDISGKQVSNGTLKNSTTVIDLMSLDEGLYIISVGNSAWRTVKRFVKISD